MSNTREQLRMRVWAEAYFRALESKKPKTIQPGQSFTFIPCSAESYADSVLADFDAKLSVRFPGGGDGA